MANRCFIIDTNIFIAANGMADHLTEQEMNKCKLFIGSLFDSSIVSLDLQGEIFQEYFNYMNRSGQPGISDAFAKYLWDRQYNKHHCEIVNIEKNKEGIHHSLL